MKAVRGVVELLPRPEGCRGSSPDAANEVGQASLAVQTQVDPTRDIGVGAPVLGAGIPSMCIN